MTAKERLWAKSRVAESGCWEWGGALTEGGYGRMWDRGRAHRVHRLAYQLYVGPIPEGLTLDHLCRNRRCFRPEHLEPVTHRVNLLRGETIQAANAAKTRCHRGHPFDEENTGRDTRGSRVCRICRREKHHREWRDLTAEQRAHRNARKRALYRKAAIERSP